MRQNNPVLSSALIVFSFWWLFFTMRDFVWSPFEVIRNWAYIGWSMRLWVIGVAVGAAGGAWFIWFKRVGAEDRLRESSTGRMKSTLGKIPTPLPEPSRASNVKKRLPLNQPQVAAWIEKATEEHPEHLALFNAVWDIYSDHRDWPASHRVGGHANRRLWEHCLAVTVMALDMAKTWKYEGVHVKTRGRKPKLIIAPSRPDFEFNGDDPLIPILALAHDIGKLEAYGRQADGTFTSREQGSTRDHDDVGVMHDALGARILARLPEFWKLPPSDRRILNLVIAHYHHPSDFPVDVNGHSIDDRMTSLLEFLIQADRKTGMEESGITADDEANEITEDESKLLWDAFVEIVTEHGRINGIHGDSKSDKGFMLGSKHGNLIVIQELPLRTQLLSKLSQSMEEGDARYRITRNLLAILAEKGLLYDNHNGIDFSRYAPMWEISHRRTKDGGQICIWRPCIIIKQNPAIKELDVLATLAEKKARLRIEYPLYTHNPNIRDVDALRELVRQAFGDKAAEKLSVPKSGSTSDDAEDQADAAPSPAPSAPATTQPAAPTPAPAAPVPATTSIAATPVAPAQPAEQAAPAAEPAPIIEASKPADLPVADNAGQPQPVEHDGAAPWEEVEAELPEGLAAADLPDTEEDGLEGIDVDIGGGDALPDTGAADFGDFGDFGDFPAATEAAAPAATQAEPEAAPAPATPPAAPAPVAQIAASASTPVPAPPAMQSPRDAALVAHLQGTLAKGHPVRDADAPKIREVGKTVKDKEALAALRGFAKDGAEALNDLAAKPKAGKKGVTIAELQAILDSGRLEIAGEHNGCRWVTRDSLRKAVGPKKWLTTTERELDLQTMAAEGGLVFIGIPIGKPT